MRVLLISAEFPPMQGGVGDYTHEIARRLALHETVRVLTGKLAMDSGPFSIAPVVARWDWSSLALVRQAVREFAPDIVDVQYQTGAFGMHPAINLMPRLLKFFSPGHTRAEMPSFVVTFHDLRIPYLFPKAGPVRGWVTRELARSSDAVIATNEQDYASLQTWGVHNLSLIPIGSNIRTDPPPGYERLAWRDRLGVAPSELLLCHFGFVNSRKGCDVLIHALAHIPNAKLLMIGGQTGASDPTNAAYLARVQALVAELGLEARVLWTGYTPPDVVTANLLAADLCVLPYREGASYRHGTLMAALAHAMPIITTAIPAAAAGSNATQAAVSTLPALRDGDNCILIRPSDPVELAQAIQRAAACPELCARIGEGAGALAQHFTWDKIVAGHLELYARLRHENLGV